MATAEFSKFVGILSVALQQQHLLGFEIAQMEFHHLLIDGQKLSIQSQFYNNVLNIPCNLLNTALKVKNTIAVWIQNVVHPHDHITDCVAGKWKDGHNSGLQGVPGRGHQVSILGFIQERFEESWW